METQRTTLWCRVLGKLVGVVLIRTPHATPKPGVPDGWEVEGCLDKDTSCYGRACPFTLEEDVREDVDWPFGTSEDILEKHNEL